MKPGNEKAAATAAGRLRILVIDDDPDLLYMVKRQLELYGVYTVMTATTGEEGLVKARSEGPDLVIVDLMMPGMDGFEFCQRLREDRITYLLPVIMLTASGTQVDKIRALQLGADDFISKPFSPAELEARVAGLIRRFHHTRCCNPLTGLPGNPSIEQEISKRLARREPLACLYIDMDNFKAYNDKYGFEKGDEVIRLIAHLLVRCAEEVGRSSDFIGHIGGDDFIYVTSPECAAPICERLIELFDQAIPRHYTEEDRQRGYIEVKNRQGAIQQFPLITLSVGVAHNRLRPLESALQVSEIATELKSAAKKKTPGRSSYVVDRRTT